MEPREALWLLSTFCVLHQRSFDAVAAARRWSPDHTVADLILLGEEVGLDIVARIETLDIQKAPLPVAVQIRTGADGVPGASRLDSTGESCGRSGWCIVLQADDSTAWVAYPSESNPRAVPVTELSGRMTGLVLRCTSQIAAAADPDIAAQTRRRFGFSWFIPELLKHKTIWREVLLASLVLQLLSLAFPLFTQAIIDKVVVHRTESTLIALAVGMAVFIVFTSALTWVRQYLVLHTGNRVDAVLGTHVFEHLFRLPPLYFQHRPTGVIAARLQGIETIREFVSSAAVTLMLDLPFLLIFVAVMFWYSVKLTLIVMAILLLIVGVSLLAAPLLRRRLDEQFHRGAANQAFLTEYIAGVETVKSLQLEPQLQHRYRDLLAAFLSASFRTRQLGNTYGTLANGLEQIMTLLVLAFGAYLVMGSSGFTVGMLVAFQMFAQRLSQPMLRLVGLWQQFQQARIAVARLGDIMDAPVEPYRLTKARSQAGRGAIRIENLSFRYADNLPYLYDGFSLDVVPGQLIAVMGPSGAGKSTLSKLMQSFYQPAQGTIRVDGIDVRHLSANELRSNFGVVPQETTLFSGTLLENLRIANPFASFEQVVAACRMAEIHSTIESLPNGYETQIGERGAGLSGGQRQRIAIARALIKGPKILIFDEATSSVDGATAEQLGRTINALKGRVTILFIAHALPKSLQVDEIVRIGERLSAVAPHARGAGEGQGAAGE